MIQSSAILPLVELEDDLKSPIEIGAFRDITRTRDLSLEFRLLQTLTENEKMSSRIMPHVPSRDRYTEVHPYEDTRVLLSDGGYINASWIGLDQRVVATQGPLPGTCEHFWEMIFHHKIGLIVALAKMVEDGRIKCHQYFPEQVRPYSTSLGKLSRWVNPSISGLTR